ncbi:hypothetical protein [Hymenobacter terricola]|nr:hypothetical protein [Hymenobacter terricola]
MQAEAAVTLTLYSSTQGATGIFGQQKAHEIQSYFMGFLMPADFTYYRRK